VPLKTDLRRLRLRQLDQLLKEYAQHATVPRPRNGWIREIRNAIGMTASHLARRLGVTQPTVADMERSEREDAITLGTLRKAARALGGELVYAIVPRVPLEQMLRDQARRVVQADMQSVSHSMRLEDQGISPEAENAQMDELIEDILRRWPRSLWAQ